VLRLFWRLFLVISVGYGASWWAVNFVANVLMEKTGNYYNDELLRGQVYELVSALRPLPTTERERHLELLRPHYGLQLALVDSASLALTSDEQAKLRADRFISRKDFSEFFAPLDPPAGTQQLRIAFPAEPAWLLYANIVAYGTLAALLGCVLLVWVRPHWRDLETLRTAANQFGDGNLAARAWVGKRSNVRELAEHFNHMADRTQRLIAAQRELTNAVSHEFRTPIARLAFELDLVAAAADEQTRARLVEEMRADLLEMEDMVSELLTYARLEHPQVSLAAVPVDAQSWLESVLGAMALEAEAKGVACGVAMNEVQTVTLEPRFMARAAINLLRNAIHYARRSVEVRVERSDTGGYRLLVDDDGPGIPEADRLRIFEPFTRLDESRARATGGFGLGLAIVRRIAQWHSGTVEVHESPLGGARFVLSWPHAAT
jgi:two-component system sensor kinase ParS